MRKAPLYVDALSPRRQRMLGLLPLILPYRPCRNLFLKLTAPGGAHEAYLTSMRLEVIWLSPRHLRRQFLHHGTEHIDPAETYIVTSLHYGQWGMYPASLYQQQGIASQMVISGRNRRPDSNQSYFWKRFGHDRQHLSGYPGRFSTDTFFQHVNQLKQGISQIVILDVRERGLAQKEISVPFLGAPLFLPRAVPLLAKRAGVRILPYLGFYDPAAGKHRVEWFPPVAYRGDDTATTAAVLRHFEPLFQEHPEFYFNDLASFRRPFPATTRSRPGAVAE